MTILITSTDRPELKDIHESVKSIIVQSGHKLLTWDDDVVDSNKSVNENISVYHDKADMLIAHLEEVGLGVGIEIGFAIAKNKPIVAICRIEDLHEASPNLFSDYNFIYDRSRLNETLLKPLHEFLIKDDIRTFLKDNSEKSKNTIFVSYSHKDIEYLERLKIHMKPIEKKGTIDFWSDTKISAGDKWKDKIALALENAAVAILFVSADFLASDFIVDNELPQLLKNAEEHGLTILPVIIKPCRFTKDENISIFQSINLPELPLSKMDESQREDTYVKIVDTIESLIKTKIISS